MNPFTPARTAFYLLSQGRQLCLSHRLCTATLAVMLTFFAGTAQAQEPLTEDRIQAFIATLEQASQMEAEFEEFNELASDLDVDMSQIFSSSLAHMEGRKEYSILADMVRSHGFSNPKEWAATGDRIFAAWMAIEMGTETPAMTEEMRQAMAQLDNNPNITEEQKAQMRAMMAPAMGMAHAASEVPPQDKAAVRPHIEALRAISNGQ